MKNYGNSTNWYAVSTNPRCEDMVYSILSREDFEVFLPRIKNSRKNKIEPLFPGYMFVRLNVKLPNWVRIKYLHGVRKILSYGEALIPVPEAIISVIKQQSIKDNNFFIKALSLKAGDKVRFLRGPFEGLEGKFTGEISGKERIKVLLDAIHHWAFKIEAEAGEISKVG